MTNEYHHYQPSTSSRNIDIVEAMEECTGSDVGAVEHSSSFPPPPMASPGFFPSSTGVVRQVSTTNPTSTETDTDVPRKENEYLEAQLAAALAAKADLERHLESQMGLSRRLEEKVVNQGRVVSDLCAEVDRLSKDNETLNERLVLQMEQRRIEMEQFRQHLFLSHAAKHSLTDTVAGYTYASSSRSSMPGRVNLAAQPPGTNSEASTTAGNGPPARRLTATGAGHRYVGSEIGTTSGTVGSQFLHLPTSSRRMSTGAAATCA